MINNLILEYYKFYKKQNKKTKYYAQKQVKPGFSTLTITFLLKNNFFFKNN